MPGLQDGEYRLRVKTEGGKTVQVVEPPLITAEELAALRREHKAMKDRLGLYSVSLMADRFRVALGVTPPQAKVLAYMLANTSRSVGVYELKELVYGKRAIGQEDDQTASIRQLIYRLRRRKTPFGTFGHEGIATGDDDKYQLLSHGVSMCTKALAKE